MTQSAIEVDGLAKVYRDGWFRRRTVHALRGVSFDVLPGSIFGLLGPNGAGKTTLIKVLLGLVRKSGGGATLLGRPAGDRQGRRRVGYLPEHHRIPRHLTGNSALTYYGGLSGMSPRQVAARRPQLLSQVGLAEWGTVSVKKYSKGMLQRLGLAQAMLHDPDLLILDEPTDGVDPVGRSEMRAILYDLKRNGKTVFINSHLLQEVELVCDRVAILLQGQLRHVGTVTELRERRSADVELRIAGDESTIREALGATEVRGWQPLGEGAFAITIGHLDTAALNACVDRLRARQLEILAIVPKRNSLEEAFLDIVTQQDSV